MGRVFGQDVVSGSAKHVDPWTCHELDVHLKLQSEDIGFSTAPESTLCLQCYENVWFSVSTVKGHNRPECQVKVIFSNCEVLWPFWPGQLQNWIEPQLHIHCLHSYSPLCHGGIFYALPAVYLNVSRKRCLCWKCSFFRVWVIFFLLTFCFLDWYSKEGTVTS